MAAVPRRPQGLYRDEWITYGRRCKRLAVVYFRGTRTLQRRLEHANPVLVGKLLAARVGWVGAQWSALYQLWNHESGWRPLAHNASSGAHGIPQALPGSKMAAYGADWYSNPATQVRWGLAYIAGRYGSPAAAWSHFCAYNWY